MVVKFCQWQRAPERLNVLYLWTQKLYLLICILQFKKQHKTDLWIILKKTTTTTIKYFEDIWSNSQLWNRWGPHFDSQSCFSLRWFDQSVTELKYPFEALHSSRKKSICCICNNKFPFDYVSTVDSHKGCSKYFVLSIGWLNRQAFCLFKTTELLGVTKIILPLVKHFSQNIFEAWGTKDQMNVT